MAAMNQDPGNAFRYVVGGFAEKAVVFVEERASEQLDLGVQLFRGVIGLLEEIGGWIN